jgi:hypothetical protein
MGGTSIENGFFDRAMFSSRKLFVKGEQEEKYLCLGFLDCVRMASPLMIAKFLPHPRSCSCQSSK